MRTASVLVMVALFVSSARAADVSSLLKGLLDKPLPPISTSSSAAGKFKPSGQRVALEAFLQVLSQKADEKKAYGDALLEVVRPIEAEFRKVGKDNDAAVALALYLVSTYQLVSGKEVSESSSDALVSQLEALFATPDLRKLTDLEKQQSYEIFLYNLALDGLLLEIAEPNQKQGVKDSAAQKLEGLLGIKSSQMQFSEKGLTLSSSPKAPAISSTQVSTLNFTVPKEWTDLGMEEGARRFTWTFSESEGILKSPDGTSSTQMVPNTLEVMVLPDMAQSGTLEGQAASLWAQITKGQFDNPGVVAPAFLARLPAGMNAAYVRGTLTNRPNPLGTGYSSKTVLYNLLYLLEYGERVTPILFMASKGDWGYMPNLDEVRPSVLNFLLSAQAPEPLNPKPLFDPKEFVGKWTRSSSFSQTYSNLYTGVYAGSSTSAYVFRNTLEPDGTMNYYAQAAQFGIGGTRVQTQNEKANWTLSGDLLTITVPALKQVNRYKVYGISRDAQNQPSLLLTFLTGYNKDGVALDSLPEDAWTMDSSR